MRVDHVYPPIPIRSFDWCATLDEYDGAPDAGRQCVGNGATRQEAIDALIADVIDAYECSDDREAFERRMKELGVEPMEVCGD